MQLLFNTGSGTGADSEVNTFKRVVLTERDFEIIDFILDMKFVSLEEVYWKFFKVTRANELSVSNLWAKDRLGQLEKARLIKSVYSFSESTRYYVATFKGYRVLSNVKPESLVAKPLPGIDQRTFVHDKFVLKSRAVLEDSGDSVSWISDRKLRSSPELTQGLSNQFIPDGLYESPAGVKVAFELEIAAKAKVRYRQKIKKYVEIMRSKDVTKRLFAKCLYVVAKDHIYDFLVKETKIYGELFEVKKFADFFPEVIKPQSKKQLSVANQSI